MKSHLSTFNYWHCASVVMPSALSSMTILTCVFFLMIYSSGLGIAPVRALVLHVQGSEFNQVLNSFCFFSPSVKCCWKWCGLKRLIQKDLQLELNLDYRARACLKLKKKKNENIVGFHLYVLWFFVVVLVEHRLFGYYAVSLDIVFWSFVRVCYLFPLLFCLWVLQVVRREIHINFQIRSDLFSQLSGIASGKPTLFSSEDWCNGKLNCHQTFHLFWRWLLVDWI
jgi:hypothetical protein